MGTNLLLFCLVLVLQVLAGATEKNPFGVKARAAPEPLVAVSRIADPPVIGEAESVSESESESSGVGVAVAPATRRLGKHHSDKSVAGGGVIIGGLVTAIFAAVFCYIRVTRKKDNAGGL